MRTPGVQRDRTATRRVVMIAFPGANVLDVTGPCEVFNAATVARRAQAPDTDGYRIEIFATTDDPSVETSCGVGLASMGRYPRCGDEIDTLLVAGGPGVWAVAEDAEFLG